MLMVTFCNDGSGGVTGGGDGAAVAVGFAVPKAAAPLGAAVLAGAATAALVAVPLGAASVAAGVSLRSKAMETLEISCVPSFLISVLGEAEPQPSSLGKVACKVAGAMRGTSSR